jgi:hypothetical protein
LGKTEILAVSAGDLQLNTSMRSPPPTFCWLNPSRFSHNVAPAWTRRRCRQPSMISKYDTGTVFFEEQCALEETRSSEQLAARNSLLGHFALRNPALGATSVDLVANRLTMSTILRVVQGEPGVSLTQGPRELARLRARAASPRDRSRVSSG